MSREREYTLVGKDGNAFAVMGYVLRIMRAEGFKEAELRAYTERAKSGDYDNLLCESIDMVDECNERRRKRENLKDGGNRRYPASTL